MDKKRDVRAIGATFVIGISGALGAWALVLSQEGCQLKNCDGDLIWLDGDLASNSAPDKPPDWEHRPRLLGHWIDDNTWESNDLKEDWLLFPAQRGYVLQPLFPPGVAARYPSELTAYLAPTQFKSRDELDDGYVRVPDQFAPGAGNIAEFFGFALVPNDTNAFGLNFDVKNDSCASYLVRVVVHFPPVGPVAPAADAGDAGDSSSSEAGDASSTLDAGDAGPTDTGPTDN